MFGSRSPESVSECTGGHTKSGSGTCQEFPQERCRFFARRVSMEEGAREMGSQWSGCADFGYCRSPISEKNRVQPFHKTVRFSRADFAGHSATAQRFRRSLTELAWAEPVGDA